MDVGEALRGSALCTAIDSEERAAGRMVVWVDDEADVSTAMMSNLFHGDPSTAVPRALRTSPMLLLLVEEPGAVVRLGGDRHDDVDGSSTSVDHRAARPGVRRASLASSFTVTAVSQPQ